MFSWRHSLMGWRQCEFAFSTLLTLYFRIRLQHCGSQHRKVATIWDYELHRMQFLFLNSWIGFTKVLLSKTDAVLYLGCVLEDGFFSNTWLRSSTFCRKQWNSSTLGVGIHTWKGTSGISASLCCQCLLLEQLLLMVMVMRVSFFRETFLKAQNWSTLKRKLTCRDYRTASSIPY